MLHNIVRGKRDSKTVLFPPPYQARTLSPRECRWRWLSEPGPHHDDLLIAWLEDERAREGGRR